MGKFHKHPASSLGVVVYDSGDVVENNFGEIVSYVHQHTEKVSPTYI